MQWYLATTKPKQEVRAEAHLQNQRIECLLPRLEVEKVVRGQVKKTIEPLFPGYIFLGFDDDHLNLSKVRSTRGIRDFVKFNGTPGLVPESVIDWLKRFLLEKPAKQSKLPQKGDRLTVLEGPFKDLEVIFEMVDGEQRAMVFLDLLGRQQRLVFELKLLKKQ